MSTIHSKDHVSFCTFTFSDGCRTPRRPGHPSLCASHARKEVRALAGGQAGEDIARYLSGQFVSACDVSSALGRLFSAVAQGHLKPKTASTLACLGHVLIQTLPIAQHEYLNAFGAEYWRRTIRAAFVSEQATPSQPTLAAQSTTSGAGK